MNDRPESATVAVAVGLTVLVLFLVWEGVEIALAPDRTTTNLLHYSRGISTSLIAALVAALFMRAQRRAAEAELRAMVEARTRQAEDAQKLAKALSDNTPAALLLIDEDHYIVESNQLAERVHGGPLVGTKCYERVSCSSKPCVECPAELPAHGPHHTDARTGEVLAIESHPLTLPSGKPGALLVERIVTEQKKMQVRLLHQEKMAAFGLLAAGVAHELGNPLASVQMHLQLIDDASLPAEAVESLRTVRHEVDRLHRTLREVVDFARRRRDEASLVSARAVVEDALRLVRHDPRMRDVRVEIDADPETPPVYIVEDHLMQVVLNLLINALDAMPTGGKLRVEVGCAARRVTVRVIDDGVGIERGMIERCFEPLFTTKEVGKGTGLGLSICRDIVSDAGGRIELHSAPGAGATVIVTLPAADRDPTVVQLRRAVHA